MKYNPPNNGFYKVRKKLTDSIFSLEEAPGGTAAPTEEAKQESVGYLSVSTFTASGALPVADVLITVYQFDENGQENEIGHYTTDINGHVPLITLPASYDRFNPFESLEYYFSTYNMRAQAINYYTVNIMDFRIFPETTTYFTLEMIPAPAGPAERPEMTIVIPPSSPDISND